jgi:hypothetical protein
LFPLRLGAVSWQMLGRGADHFNIKHASVLGARLRLSLGSLFLKDVAELNHVLLSPLAEDDRCWVKLAMIYYRQHGSNLPFKNFLLAYFLKKASWMTGPER